jgi:arylsulfatase A-like enzyme
MNVIMLINDSLRQDHLGCYGNTWIQTPNLDRLASEGAVFDYCYSEGLPTIPTRTTFFTGRFTFPTRGWQRLEPTDLLLSEILWNRSVRTAMVTDTYHLHKPQMGFERGFDYTCYVRGQEADLYVTDPAIQVDVDRYYKGNGKDTSVKGQLIQYLRNTAHWTGEEDAHVAQVVKEALLWLERHKDKGDFMLWVDCFDPHEPWNPPPPYNRMYTDPNYRGMDIIHPIPGPVAGYLTLEELNHVKKLYAGKVTLCDRWMGYFLDEVRRMGLYDNSLIIHTTDHGHPFGEHGFIKKIDPGLYDELVRIPLIIRHPEGIGAGKRFSPLVETTEIFSTILDFFKVSKVPRVHGASLLPLMAGQTDKIRDYAYMGYFKRTWRVSDHTWSFTLSLEKGRPNELYNLKEDPAEQKNLVNEEKQKAAELELELRRFVASLH